MKLRRSLALAAALGLTVLAAGTAKAGDRVNRETDKLGNAADSTAGGIVSVISGIVMTPVRFVTGKPVIPELQKAGMGAVDTVGGTGKVAVYTPRAMGAAVLDANDAIAAKNKMQTATVESAAVVSLDDANTLVVWDLTAFADGTISARPLKADGTPGLDMVVVKAGDYSHFEYAETGKTVSPITKMETPVYTITHKGKLPK